MGREVGEIAFALVSGFLLGLVLGDFQPHLARVFISLPTSFSFSAFLNVVRMGVFEEVAFRLLFYACLYPYY
ncbi:hypothetical protein SMU85_05955 [Streptococcus mutans ST6]|uniref:hypothetical protein n=1 Tax=Streptococcus mutans TaxID=1309 RepID=UPI0002B51FE1|nr:hypothetical protein [Streptococcus mutans]EMC28260.1 hypothetical protein SMU85_05955 [Streptococcus mutans ST6]